MGLFDFLKPKSDKQFVSENDFKENQLKQIQMTPQTLDQLRAIDVNETDELKLEYFFYTNKLEKASHLSNAVKKLNYSVDYGPSAGDKNLFIVTGWSTKMLMSNNIVEKWASNMCEIGYASDCEFDGWGTTPEQD